MDQLDVAGQINDQLVTVLASVSTIGTLQTATPIILSSLVTILDDTMDAINAAVAGLDAEIITDSLAGVVPGVAVPDLWPLLVGQANDSRQLATLLTTRAYMGRMRANTENSPG